MTQEKDSAKAGRRQHDSASVESIPKTESTLVRSFETGATRSAETGRYDPEGFLSPLVIERYCEYMNRNRVQPNGTIRDSDNWQKGIPLTSYMKGLWRHFLHFWTRHRGYVVQDPMASANIEDDLCAILFNASGYLHEVMKVKQGAKPGAARSPLENELLARYPGLIFGTPK